LKENLAARHFTCVRGWHKWPQSRVRWPTRCAVSGTFLVEAGDDGRGHGAGNLQREAMGFQSMAANTIRRSGTRYIRRRYAACRGRFVRVNPCGYAATSRPRVCCSPWRPNNHSAGRGLGNWSRFIRASCRGPFRPSRQGPEGLWICNRALWPLSVLGEASQPGSTVSETRWVLPSSM